MTHRASTWLGHAAPLLQPQEELRGRLLDQLVGLGPEQVCVRAAGGAWEPGAHPGLSLKYLLRDAGPARYTALARMVPGTIYPGHRHADLEELYVLEGDLQVQGRRMGPGDFCAAVPQTVHHEVRSVGGGTFLITASEEDQPCAGPATGSDGLHFAMSAEAAWREDAGVSYRVLFRDPGAGRATAVALLRPGGELALEAPLQLYVLEGQVEVGGTALEAGDFRYQAQAQAVLARTGGTVLLIDSAGAWAERGAPR